LDFDVLISPPIMVELASNKRDKNRTILKRNWRGCSKDLLLEELDKVDWNIDCTQVQDFNNELEQKLLTIIDNMIHVQMILEKEKRIFEAEEF
jgi:hypothetical protein